MTIKKWEGRSLDDIGYRLLLTRLAISPKSIQAEYSEAAGVRENTYNQYEKGKKRPSVDNAYLLKDTYGISLDWIYDGDPSGLPYSLFEAIKAVAAQFENEQRLSPSASHKKPPESGHH